MNVVSSFSTDVEKQIEKEDGWTDVTKETKVTETIGDVRSSSGDASTTVQKETARKESMTQTPVKKEEAVISPNKDTEVVKPSSVESQDSSAPPVKSSLKKEIELTKQHKELFEHPTMIPEVRSAVISVQEETGQNKADIQKSSLSERDEKKGFFSRIGKVLTTTTITPSDFEKFFAPLELALLENNCAFEVVEKIRLDLKKVLLNANVSRGKVEETIMQTLRKSVLELFAEPPNVLGLVRMKEKKPFVILFVGVNGSGKTTTIAKLTRFFQNNGLSVVLAAGDTFRAAAIDQLQLHANKLGVRLIRHEYGSDAAAVAYDAIRHAEAHKKDVVLVDTAGRLHTNTNLMDELRKISRVAKPDLKIFVGEAIAGNDCVEQAREFNTAINIDGIILTKSDVDDKGGAFLSVNYVTKKPLLFTGKGQDYDDLVPFDASIVLRAIGM